jgi:hypothetical protein
MSIQSQKDRAEAIIAELLKRGPELAQLAHELSEVLREAQEPPPAGKSDRTIEPRRWNRLETVRFHLGECLTFARLAVKGPKDLPL